MHPNLFKLGSLPLFHQQSGDREVFWCHLKASGWDWNMINCPPSLLSLIIAPATTVLPNLDNVSVVQVGNDFSVLSWTPSGAQRNVEFEVQFQAKTSKSWAIGTNRAGARAAGGLILRALVSGEGSGNPNPGVSGAGILGRAQFRPDPGSEADMGSILGSVARGLV